MPIQGSWCSKQSNVATSWKKALPAGVWWCVLGRDKTHEIGEVGEERDRGRGTKRWAPLSLCELSLHSQPWPCPPIIGSTCPWVSLWHMGKQKRTCIFRGEAGSQEKGMGSVCPNVSRFFCKLTNQISYFTFRVAEKWGAEVAWFLP